MQQAKILEAKAFFFFFTSVNFACREVSSIDNYGYRERLKTKSSQKQMNSA